MQMLIFGLLGIAGIFAREYEDRTIACDVAGNSASCQCSSLVETDEFLGGMQYYGKGIPLFSFAKDRQGSRLRERYTYIQELTYTCEHPAKIYINLNDWPSSNRQVLQIIFHDSGPLYVHLDRYEDNDKYDVFLEFRDISGTADLGKGGASSVSLHGYPDFCSDPCSEADESDLAPHLRGNCHDCKRNTRLDITFTRVPHVLLYQFSVYTGGSPQTFITARSVQTFSVDGSSTDIALKGSRVDLGAATCYLGYEKLEDCNRLTYSRYDTAGHSSSSTVLTIIAVIGVAAFAGVALFCFLYIRRYRSSFVI